MRPPRPSPRDIQLVRLFATELDLEEADIEPKFTDWERSQFLPNIVRQVQRRGAALSERQRQIAEQIAGRIEAQAPSMEILDT